jgi:glycosyltransferase involved in cell wall biosynthesis
MIALYALSHWNAYLETGAYQHKASFLIQANWFVRHECRLGEDMSGWPLSCPRLDHHTSQLWLSALTQGQIISVLVRAYRLTGDEEYLNVARRAVKTFERDILDNGVSTPVGDDGVFFEEIAVYPASHILNGFMLALFGLYDFVALTGNAQIVELISRGHRGLHRLINEYDAGYWSCYDLLYRRLARTVDHALHVTSLEVLAELSGCKVCAGVAVRWAEYQRQPSAWLHYFVVSRSGQAWRALCRLLRRIAFGTQIPRARGRRVGICVPVAAFPVAGGTRGVLAGISQTMAAEWDMEYLTQYEGMNPQGLVIHRFGLSKAHPWQFPNVWLYVFAGWGKLLQLLRDGHHYRMILPQDGAFSGAFSALVGRMADVRVVCMDHGNVTLPVSPTYRAERMQMLKGQPWINWLASRIRFSGYWPSLRLLTWVAVRASDHFLPAGDDVEEALIRQYRVRPSQITRFPFMIDVNRFTPFTEATRVQQREQHAIPCDAIVIALVNRLAIEKGLDIAIQGIRLALATLPSEERARVRMIIAGDGPLRAQLEADLRRYGLEQTCSLWGEATPDEVRMLLGISDIFLYTGTRGINPVAVLEAMAAGCAVIGATAPHLVAEYLAEGRGLAIAPGDAEATASALLQAIGDLDRSREMGRRARDYVTTHHTAAALRRSLLRATFWAPSIEGRLSATVKVGDNRIDGHEWSAGRATPTTGSAERWVL